MGSRKPYFTLSSRYEDPAARLSFVMRAAGLGPVALARRLGLSGPEVLYRIAETRSPIPPELVRLIHRHYPQIDANWLRHGPARPGSGV